MDQSSVGRYPGAALPASHFMVGSSSFTDFLAAASPESLPGRRVSGVPAGVEPIGQHGTTIVAAIFRGGVLIAGDRRAVAGNLIAQRDMDKVFVVDDYSAVGIAGTAGVAVEMVRLFTVELQHYEKL
jgi:proteasome beta subunit